VRNSWQSCTSKSLLTASFNGMPVVVRWLLSPVSLAFPLGTEDPSGPQRGPCSFDNFTRKIYISMPENLSRDASDRYGVR